jgi:AcrR family transcriptional regulator
MPKHDPIQRRTRLIEAAKQIIVGQGFTALTLDSVCAQAGISKGGLLHHFPNKEALIEGLLAHLFASFTARVETFHAAEPNGPGRWMRAYIQASLEDNPVSLQIVAALVTSIASQPSLIRMVHDDDLFWATRLLNDGLSAGRVMVLRGACDSYWSARLINSPAHNSQTQQILLHELLILTNVEQTLP